MKSKLKSRYKTLLNMPDWTDEQLETLEGRLRGKISADALNKQHLVRRLEWDAFSYLSSIDKDNELEKLLEGV